MRNRNTLVFALLLLIAVSYTSCLATYLYLIRKTPSKKYFAYNPETNTLTIYGGSREDPITWGDLQHALKVMGLAKTENHTIIVNTKIIVEG